MSQEVIDFFLEKGFLLSPDFVNSFNGNIDDFYDKVNKKVKENLLVINGDLFLVINNLDLSLKLNWNEYDKARVVFEKEGHCLLYDSFLDLIGFNITDEQRLVLEGENCAVQVYVEEDKNKVVVVKSYNEPIHKKCLDDFVQYFKKRYEALKGILILREQLQSSLSINRILTKPAKESVALIGLVKEKNITKNGNIMFTIEDVTGEIKVLVTKTKEDVYENASEVMLDEVIGITGVTGNKIVFSNNLFFPDISVSNELKKAPEESYVAFISDIHVGLNLFLEKDFENFITFLNGEYGTKVHQDIASKLNYLFLVGDLVEGIGIYPDQEKDLYIKDVTLQYDKLVEYLRKIPKRIKIIVCAGNHDPLRLAEPQPPLDKKYASKLYEMDNVIFVSNPAVVNIHSSKDFVGFNVLMYHGGSFPYFADNISTIRGKGGQKRTDLIMKYLLQRRHLAPTHGSTLYVPESSFDPLVIDSVPDFFVSGHLHTLTTANYRNVTLINCGCWAEQSADMERRGIVPEPSKVPIVNLKTREVKILNFRAK